MKEKLVSLESLEELSRLEIGAVCAAFGAIGGALSYGLKVAEGKHFRWGEFLLHLSISAFCGFCTYEILAFWGFPAGVSSAVCGMSGWMGTRLIKILEVVIRKRLGVEKSELEEENK